MKESRTLYERENTDDILVRSVIAGVLNILNNRIDYEQIWGDNKSTKSEDNDETIIQTVNVPWFYSMGSSGERFMQDNYTWFGNECMNKKVLINGTTAPKPVGWLTYTGSTIDSSSITNRFVQGTYMKKVNGRLISYTSFLYSIPLTINFDCKIEVDNVVTGLKIEQAIREVFYKNLTFFIQYRGMQIGCTAGFPEQINLEKSTEYSFDNAQNSPTLTFSLAVETYQPVFDKTTEMERSKYIRGIGLDVYVPYTGLKNEVLKKLEIKGPDNSISYPSGTTMLIEWIWRSKDSDFLPVQISYIDKECDCEEKMIAECTDNQSCYFWDIPEDFTGFKQPIITIDPNATVIRQPKIKVVPNKEGYIDDNSFIILDRGYIDYEYDDVPFTMEYEYDDLPVFVKGYKFRLDNGRIDSSDPILVSKENIHKYKGDIKKRNISIIVKYTKDKSIMSKIDNILIY